MTHQSAEASRNFHLTLISPAQYDARGYPLRWRRSRFPNGALACLYGLAQQCATDRVLGDDVEMSIDAWDESNCRLPLRRIARRIRRNSGLVALVGVQSNQYPRALDLVRRFREYGVAVAIGGFHVSAVHKMHDALHPGLQEAIDAGASLFVGEAEDRFAGLLRDAHLGRLQPVYEAGDHSPALENQPVPSLPEATVRRTIGQLTAFDAGRGCPFSCNFCSIHEVHGHASRCRHPDDIEALVRANAENGVRFHFVADDNLARNRQWEAILDRLIGLREQEGLDFRFIAQVDASCHRVPGFIEKAARAGCRQVFIGTEGIREENLVAINKRHNRVADYRDMFLRWRRQGVLINATLMIGFPGDTPEKIREDVRVFQEELPVDALSFTLLTPLPGTALHKEMEEKGIAMDPDLSRYDLTHQVVDHPTMSREEVERTLVQAYHWYYTDEHIERLMRRAVALGQKTIRIMQMVVHAFGSAGIYGMHPQQVGVLRHIGRRERRPDFERESIFTFYGRRVAETCHRAWQFARLLHRVHRIRQRVEADTSARQYVDDAIAQA